MRDVRMALHGMYLVALWCAVGGVVVAQTESAQPSFADLKTIGAQRSTYRTHAEKRVTEAAPEPDLQTFRRDIAPILAKACVGCHGPDKQKGDLRIDTLDPDLFHGKDVEWWLHVLSVLSNGEMPPEDENELADGERRQMIDWLVAESQSASLVRRATKVHSSFRRMTRYEYDYALQDLLLLPYDFGNDLPPDPTSADGFQNSSEVLHLSGMQFRVYLESARKALRLAVVSGDRPEPIYWGVAMDQAATVEWKRQDAQLLELKKKHAADPEKLAAALVRQTERNQARPDGAHYLDRKTGRRASQSWGYDGARFAWKPTTSRPEVSETADQVAVIPEGKGLIVELGDQVPEHGTLRVAVRAARADAKLEGAPSLQLVFGWQASNDSQAAVRVRAADVVIDAAPEAPQVYQWDVPLSQIYPRNSVRKISQMGDLPSPSEYLKFVNSSESGGDILIEHVEVAAPVYDQWPPACHTRIFVDSGFVDSGNVADERAYAREVLANFTSRAWRREASNDEIDRKVRLFEQLRPQCDSFQDAMIEVLATVLASPNFLYLVESAPEPAGGEALAAEAASKSAPRLSDLELATRLSMFLWCSTPDADLLALAKQGQLQNTEVLGQAIERLLADPKSRRFSLRFARQWLGLQLLDYLHVDGKVYPQFDPALQEAMREEPVAFFHEVLQHDLSALEFLHSDFTMMNERLAKHYGSSNVFGNHFRRVELVPEQRRGGLLTEAGLLAMNSDGKDSHPLKRGIWMLERMLNDPPPPPPAAVPVIDLADPAIAKMTLKQRIENHRNAPACMSCHSKIDPWGIAFENYDAVGQWRTEVLGQPVDAVGVLFNRQQLEGMDGLKRFLLENRQDQFIRALVYKLLTFALGRPLSFGDRAAIDEITADVRKHGDGLATMVRTIATSELFRSK